MSSFQRYGLSKTNFSFITTIGESFPTLIFTNTFWLITKSIRRINKNKKLSVNVPSGVDNGTRIRLAGEGEAGQRGADPRLGICIPHNYITQNAELIFPVTVV